MINKVILLGRAGGSAQMRIYEGGVKKAWFPLVTNEKYRTVESVIKERTTWHTVVCWGGLADFVFERVQKGDLIYVEGRLSYYENKGKVYVEVTAINFKLLSPPRGASQKASEPEDLPLDAPPDIPELSDENIPF